MDRALAYLAVGFVGGAVGAVWASATIHRAVWKVSGLDLIKVLQGEVVVKPRDEADEGFLESFEEMFPTEPDWDE